jgi:hypothetical protein
MIGHGAAFLTSRPAQPPPVGTGGSDAASILRRIHELSVVIAYDMTELGFAQIPGSSATCAPSHVNVLPPPMNRRTPLAAWRAVAIEAGAKLLGFCCFREPLWSS